jgi:hypothetical protein
MRSWLLLALAACTSMPSSGRPFSPVAVTPGAGPVAAPAAAPIGPQGDATAFEDDRTEGDDDAERPPSDDPDDKLARMAAFAATPPPPAPAPAAPAVLPLPPTPAPVWDPSRPLPDASFGVRVLGVLLDLNPPRAILGLPDGREQVVTPGAMLPTEGLVVMAIGRDAVQLAHVIPNGFYARVQTETVQSLSAGRAQLVPVPVTP